jgi:hypothetical protein
VDGREQEQEEEGWHRESQRMAPPESEVAVVVLCIFLGCAPARFHKNDGCSGIPNFPCIPKRCKTHKCQVCLT